MRKVILAIMLAALLMPAGAYAEGKSISELRQIVQAGASLILDLDSKAYSVAELSALASSLKFQATLTIKVGRAKLSTAQCAQIAGARPGQVVFWF